MILNFWAICALILLAIFILLTQGIFGIYIVIGCGVLAWILYDYMPKD